MKAHLWIICEFVICEISDEISNKSVSPLFEKHS